MKNSKHFNLSSSESLELKKLMVEWQHVADELHRQEFGKPYHDFGSVIGAGVVVYRRVPGNGRVRLYEVARWRGSGMTGESEAFNKVEPKLKAVGFEARYNFGMLD
jgi:hypothetical protein